MGYYSSVYIASEDKSYKMLKEALSKYHIKPDKDVTVRGMHLMTFDFTKWYYSDPGVEAVRQTMSELEDGYAVEEGYAYKFIRLGEEIGDTEERANDRGYEVFEDMYLRNDCKLPDVFN